jgi:hypothetical protein
VHNRSLAIALAIGAAFGSARVHAVDSTGVARVMGGHSAPDVTPNNRRHTGVAADKRAARKRRNVRARSAKH